ncbi:hypothetical protein HY251_20375 [bacterium]|nr:hypothetical protein [bacterium]
MALRVKAHVRRPETAAAPRPEEKAPPAGGGRIRASLGEALRTANSVLPWPNRRRASVEEWLLHAGFGVPTSCAFLWAIGSFSAELAEASAGEIAAIAVAGALLATVATFALSWATTFVSSLGVSALGGGGARGRVHEALVCPYCRDSVGSEGTVVCARPRCGALYHRECWQECSEQYGGCAVYGCSSRKCNEVSATGYVFRLARLFLAAVLFPPRLARAIRNTESKSFVSNYQLALAKAREVHASWNLNSTAQMGLVFLLGVPISYVIPGLAIWLWRAEQHVPAPLFLCWALVVPFVALLFPFLVALPLTLGFYTAKTIARAFEAELGALGRADEGGTTVIGRLRLGLGKKS